MTSAMKNRAAVGAAVLALTAGISVMGTGTAEAAGRIPCPAGVWVQGEDRECVMVFDGPGGEWWAGRWVALHVRSGDSWVNGYDPYAHERYSVWIDNNQTPGKYSQSKSGGGGVGLATGTVPNTSSVHGVLSYSGGNKLTVRRY